MCKQLIKAKNLASGDTVRFPRKGWLQIERITFSSSLSLSFRFADGKIRSFRPEQEVEAFLTTCPPSPATREILRVDKESGRASICLAGSLFDMKDISESFELLRVRVSCTREAAVLIALELGATLYTHDAIYTMPKRELAYAAAA